MVDLGKPLRIRRPGDPLTGLDPADQIRTEMSPAGIHAGAAQLLLNGLSLPGDPLLLLALPRAPEDALREKLKRLNIDLLIYGWQGDRAVFPDLAAYLPRIAS